MNRLPRSLDDLEGLRAARWIRESTARQEERYGPEAQREQQDRAMGRYGLVDAGLSWQVAHSGRTIAESPAFAEMLEAAGDRFDVLLVGYVSRFARDLRTAVNARHDLHQRGAALLFCDERVLSSDEAAWETWAREAVEAEAYSRRLGRRVAEGYEAKFRRERDPGGSAPLGFRRVGGLLEVDPGTIALAVEAFAIYATGTVSLPELERRTGIDHEALKAMLRHPIYNGWVRRHRRSPDERLLPARWRDDPPVPDALWERVQAVRRDRDTGGGRSMRRHVHLLAGRLFCAGCGARIRSEMRSHPRWPHRRYRHRDACPAWDRDTRPAHLFDDVVGAQLSGIDVGDAMLADLRRLAAMDSPTPDAAGRRRRSLERDLEELAKGHARRAIGTDEYLAEHARLVAALDAAPDGPTGAPVEDPDAVIAELRDVRRMWRGLGDAARHQLVLAVYERIRVTPDGIVDVKLTEHAQRHGMALALPEAVLVEGGLARPEGLEPPRPLVVPIVDRPAWLELLRSA